MPLLKKRRAHGGSEGALTRLPVGPATVVHGPGGVSDQARVLAMSLAPDPDCDVVVVDLPADGSPQLWESLADLLRGGSREMRLVPCDQACQAVGLAAQWLSGKLGRTVYVPDGSVRSGSNGVLFSGSGTSGWVRFRPGEAPAGRGRRFPVPAWDSPIVAKAGSFGTAGRAEPLPAGVWLRPDGRAAWLDATRARLIRWLSFQPEILSVVLGCPGTAELTLTDVAQWWAMVPAELRARVRFVHYGPVHAPGADVPGQALADLLSEHVICYTGLPVGPAQTPEVVTMRADGSHGWSMYVQQVAYSPRSATSDGPSPPRMVAHRRPIEGLSEIAQGVYRYSGAFLLEVVQSGLWIRPPGELPHAAGVRARAADPAHHLVLYEAADQESRVLAEELLDRLDDTVQSMTRIVPANTVESHENPSNGTDPASQVSLLSPLLGEWPTTRMKRTADAEEPSVPQEEPDPEVSAYVGTAEPTAEREAVRASCGAEFDTLADQIRSALAKTTPQGMSEGLVTDALAVRLYLEGREPGVDGGLRAARAGSHVAFGRCVAAGLRRLPAYRGAAAVSLTPTRAEWELCDRHSVFTEWGFLNLLAGPDSAHDGDTDLLVWSTTGRRTALLEPVGEGVENRILFLPGTSFKVLETVEPGIGRRGRILLRERTASELDERGEADRSSLDELATASLVSAAQRWAQTESGAGIPAAVAERFRRMPGVR
jgi:hypothetical protein